MVDRAKISESDKKSSYHGFDLHLDFALFIKVWKFTHG